MKNKVEMHMSNFEIERECGVNSYRNTEFELIWAVQHTDLQLESL